MLKPSGRDRDWTRAPPQVSTRSVGLGHLVTTRTIRGVGGGHKRPTNEVEIERVIRHVMNHADNGNTGGLVNEKTTLAAAKTVLGVEGTRRRVNRPSSFACAVVPTRGAIVKGAVRRSRRPIARSVSRTKCLCS